jgi:HAE1 family hydrophobic/amphiphilic exporter-1
MSTIKKLIDPGPSRQEFPRSKCTEDSPGTCVQFLVLCLFLLFTPSANARAETAKDGAYQSLSLEDCLALARENSPLLSGAAEKVRELLADYQAARSEFFPKLALVSHYERSNPDRLSPGGGNSNMALFKEEGLVSVAGKQLLFNGGKTRYDMLAARIGADAQRQEELRTADEVTYAVTEAYYRLLEAKEDLKAATEALKQRQEFVVLTEAFFKAGKVTRLDSLRAQSQVSDAELAGTEAENAVFLAGEILARTMGLKEQALVDIREGLPQEFMPAPGIDSLWQETLKNNPEIRRLDLEVEQNRALARAAEGGYFPEVSLQGNTGRRHQDTGGSRDEWMAGVFLEFPFFEGGLTKARTAAADSRYLQSIERKRDRLNGLHVDLSTAWKDWENARQGVTATQQTLAANEEAYKSSETLYRYGKAIGLDVLQAQVDLTASRFDFIRYAVNYEIARARVEQIAGSKQRLTVRERENGGQEK